VRFVWLSEQTQTFPLYVISRLVIKTETESVYCAVRTESLYNTDTSRSLKVNMVPTPNLASMGLTSPTFSPPSTVTVE
jgi:hypothetical protein